MFKLHNYFNLEPSFLRSLATAMVALFLTLMLVSSLRTPTVKLTPAAYETTGCVGHPKYRPDITWRVLRISGGKVLFENGNNLYEEAVVLKGTCD